MNEPPASTRRTTAKVVAAAVSGSLVLLFAEVGLLAGGRAVLDQRAYVSDLRLDAALKTFRPVDRPGLAQPVDLTTFAADRNPRTVPSACAPLTRLASTAPLDARSWTGVNGRPAQPVTLLTLRYTDARAARAELDTKRVVLLRCTRIAITFPPYAAPATTYDVSGRHWATSAVGDTVRWSLDGGGRHFDFYVRRYANTLSWTYADDVSTPEVREQVADSLVARLEELAHQ